jgi:hypothetical protein
MKKRIESNKKEWQKPDFESLKFSQTLGGVRRQDFESVTFAHGKHSGTMS